MATKDPLLGPRLKVERAKRHLSDLELAMKSFFEANPYELVTEIDPQTSEEVYRVRIHKCIPNDLSAITGDVVHNLRSALDQLVCGLVRANRKQVRNGNGFPIMGSAKSFNEACTRKLVNVPPNAQRFVRRLKPYKGGNAGLWMISELDNMDKHNEIVPIAAGRVQMQMKVGMPGIFLTPEGGLGFGVGSAGSVPLGFQMGWMVPSGARLVELLHDNCEIYRGNAKLAHFPREMQATIAITFGKTKVTNNEPIVETLKNLVQLVDRIINIVERRIL